MTGELVVKLDKNIRVVEVQENFFGKVFYSDK